MAEERKSYKITDPVTGRVITVTTDKPMTAELGMQYLKQTFGGKLTFDDLANDSNYLTDLKAEHYKSSNDKWEGTDEELIEKDFEYWNMVENNLAVGGVELATTFANLDQKDAQRMLRRYDVYDRTAATGEGSRSGWEQFKGVSKAMLTDPTNYAGGIGIFKLLATKLGGKGAMRFILTKIAAPSAIGATYAGVANYENQKMKEQLGERESIDRGELGANIAQQTAKANEMNAKLAQQQITSDMFGTVAQGLAGHDWGGGGGGGLWGYGKAPKGTTKGFDAAGNPVSVAPK